MTYANSLLSWYQVGTILHTICSVIKQLWQNILFWLMYIKTKTESCINMRLRYIVIEKLSCLNFVKGYIIVICPLQSA